MAAVVDDKHMGTDGYRRGGVGEVVMGDALGHDPNLPGTIASAYRGDHHADLAYQCLTTHHRSLPTSAPRGAARHNVCVQDCAPAPPVRGPSRATSDGARHGVVDKEGVVPPYFRAYR